MTINDFMLAAIAIILAHGFTKLWEQYKTIYRCGYCLVRVKRNQKLCMCGNTLDWDDVK